MHLLQTEEDQISQLYSSIDKGKDLKKYQKSIQIIKKQQIKINKHDIKIMIRENERLTLILS